MSLSRDDVEPVILPDPLTAAPVVVRTAVTTRGASDLSPLRPRYPLFRIVVVPHPKGGPVGDTRLGSGDHVKELGSGDDPHLRLLGACDVVDDVQVVVV